MKKRKAFLPLSRPSITKAEIKEVVSCLKSGWITTGPRCIAFEKKYADLTGARYAVSVSSGTAGMHLMMLALGIRKGDEIITPSMTFASTTNMIALCRAKPVFVDIEYDTLNIDPGLIEDRITERTKAIIPVHFAGAPANMGKIVRIAKKYDIPVIEDAAHATGTYYRGIHAGGFGQIAIFSFHPIKNITTGEGGMITHNDGDLDRRLRLLRFHGIERDAWKRYGKGGNPDYDITQPGFKYNMTDIQAGLGIAQLSRLGELNRRRSHLSTLYMEGLKDVQGMDLPGVPEYSHIHSWHIFVIKIRSMPRDVFMAKLSDYNIGYGYHFPATHRLSAIRKRYGRTMKGDLRETERAADRLVSLPLFPDMKDADVHYVCDAIKEILNRAS